MVDRREQILARLEVVLAAEATGGHFKRNELTVPDLKSGDRFILLLDGDEDADDSAFGRNQRPASSPNMIYMAPEIYVLVQEDPVDVGPALNLMRQRIKGIILNDTELLSYTKDKDIRYEGIQTALALGRSMAGEMGMNFTFVYMSENSVVVEEPTESTEG